jgi:hypothetical protein
MPFLTVFSALASPLDEAAAEERQGAINARQVTAAADSAASPANLAKIIKGTKKVAYYPKTRHFPRSLARHLASPYSCQLLCRTM